VTVLVIRYGHVRFPYQEKEDSTSPTDNDLN
jgi:hypothetical protein